MQSINEKLKKLDKLDTISARLDAMDVDIQELKTSLTFEQQSSVEIKTNLRNHNKAIQQLEAEMKKIEADKKKLESDIIEITAHSMRNNLIFHNVKEETEEKRITIVKTFI